jgi:hypothetical protein
MKNSKRFLTFLLVVITSILGLFIVAYFTGYLIYSSENANIPSLFFCETENPQIKIYPSDNYVFSSFHSVVYACGYLQTKGHVYIDAYLYKDGIESPVYSSTDIKVSEGEFSIKLNLPTKDRAGSYHVVIYYFRNILASQTFKIVNP